MKHPLFTNPCPEDCGGVMTDTPGTGAHVERPTKLADGKTYCSCGAPWPCPGDEGRYGRSFVLADWVVRDAALDALAEHTGQPLHEKPWWNLNMPKALDIMLPSVRDAIADFIEAQAEWEAPNAAEALRFVATKVRTEVRTDD